MNIALTFSDPATMIEAIDAGVGRAPQHNSHVREFRAVRWERIMAEQHDRVSRAIAERRAAGIYDA